MPLRLHFILSIMRLFPFVDLTTDWQRYHSKCHLPRCNSNFTQVSVLEIMPVHVRYIRSSQLKCNPEPLCESPYHVWVLFPYIT